MTEPKYKWNSPYEWLENKVKEWTPEQIKVEFLDLAQGTDSDTLQDIYQVDMYEDGYFEPIE